MTALVAFEWLKFRKRLMPKIIILLLVILTGLAFWGQATRDIGRDNLLLPRGWLAALSFAALFAPFFWPILGGSWAGNEYGWGTLRAILARRPNRIGHALVALAVLLAGTGIGLAAILVVGTGAGIVVSLLTGNAVWVSGLMGGTFLATLVQGFLATWYISGFFLVLAYTCAVLARSAAVGIGIGVGATLAQFVLSRILEALGGVWEQIAQHFPIVYTNDMITHVVGSQMVPGTNLAVSSPGSPSAGQSVLALAIYAGVLLAAMLYAVRVRDVTA
jgi:hypothetical protein